MPLHDRLEVDPTQRWGSIHFAVRLSPALTPRSGVVGRGPPESRSRGNLRPMRATSGLSVVHTPLDHLPASVFMVQLAVHRYSPNHLLSALNCAHSLTHALQHSFSFTYPIKSPDSVT